MRPLFYVCAAHGRRRAPSSSFERGKSPFRDVAGISLHSLPARARSPAANRRALRGSRVAYVGLADSLELVVLLRDTDQPRFERAALRWHARFCAEARVGGLADGAAVLSLLTALSSGQTAPTAVRALRKCATGEISIRSPASSSAGPTDSKWPRRICAERPRSARRP